MKVKNLVKKQASLTKEPWNLMRASNWACYPAARPKMDLFFFEAEIESANKNPETPEDAAKIDALLSGDRFSFRHYSYGVGPDRKDRPRYDQLLSSQRLSESSLTGSRGTIAADWIMLGNEAFVFCTIAVGDVPVYDEANNRPWYTELNPDKITDAWSSLYLWGYFETAIHPDEEASDSSYYWAQTAEHARVRMKQAKESTGRSVPMVRGNGRELLRALARLLIREEIDGKPVNAENSDDAIVKKIREIFMNRDMEAKVAQTCIPLDLHTDSEGRSAWAKNPLVRETRRLEHPSPSLTYPRGSSKFSLKIGEI
ncbi:hypothetical protein AB8O64_36275 (plasmid) [Streptomyces sp. QH1-20]|uniref:hypothetical protein n=1 Tax=Streptomyces sp. QH1-20 TaxID=3240934 RepID=UPI0035138D7E